MRFTPTRVGKTLLLLIGTVFVAVHPHACGENVQRVGIGVEPVRFTPTRVGKTDLCRFVLRRVGGSPPRVWGKLSLCAAGVSSRAVHPHACGENAKRY